MYLAITIDVEEDNWSDYKSEPVLSNIGKLTELQSLFDKYDVKPTYLISYPVATDKNSISILRKILDRDRCEIGAHLHPWNTPPFEEEKTVKNTMLFNLGKELQYRKLESLHQKIVENFKMEPITFRSGRWGFDQTVAENIHRLGYKVDTSVSPIFELGKLSRAGFLEPLPDAAITAIGNSGSPDSSILEVPATIGFLQDNYDRCNARMNAISGSALRHFRLIGVLDRLNILNKVWLSPESDDAGNMIRLAESVKRNKYPILNMFFHSPSLQHGLTHFTKTKEEEKELTRRIEKFLEYTAISNIEPITMSESLKIRLQ